MRHSASMSFKRCAERQSWSSLQGSSIHPNRYLFGMCQVIVFVMKTLVGACFTLKLTKLNWGFAMTGVCCLQYVCLCVRSHLTRFLVFSEDCNYTEWSTWSNCSAPCDGVGYRIRNRSEPQAIYRKTSCISRTKSQSLNVSCTLLQLPSLNPLKPGVKLRMKM